MIFINISIAALVVVAVLLVLYAFLTYPGKRRDISPELLGTQYAHRGLHDAEHPENSLSAFALAVKNGYGIELDVRLSKDGVLVVFHDDTLDRVAGIPGKVIDFTAKELSEMRLGGSEEGIPTLAEVLDLVNGRVPLLVEIKEGASDRSVSLATAPRGFSALGRQVTPSILPRPAAIRLGMFSFPVAAQEARVFTFISPNCSASGMAPIPQESRTIRKIRFIVLSFRTAG